MPISVAKMPFTLTDEDLKNIDSKPVQSNSNAQSQSVWNLTPNLNNPAANFVFGAGDALRNTLSGAMNLIPGVNIPAVKTGQGIAYNIGNAAGNIGSFMGGGEVLDASRALGESIPIAGNALNYLGQSDLIPSALRRASGSALYGASEDQNDKLKSAGESAALSSAFDLLPPAFIATSEAVSPIINQYKNILSPDKYAEDIINNISSGKGLEQSGKDIAAQIKNNYEENTKSNKKLFDPIFQKYGNKKIYNVNQSPLYFNIDDSITDSYPAGLNRVHQNFLNDSTFKNASDLSKELSANISSLENKYKKSGLTPDEFNTKNSLYTAKTALNDDMNTFFSRNDTNKAIGNDYDDANTDWIKNVLPYRSDRDILNMANGTIKNPTNIASIFRNPEPTTEKVVQDLPDEMRNNIVYSVMGSPSAQKNAKNLMSAYNSLDSKGLSSYATPELQQSMSKLGSGLATKDVLNKILGVYLGAHVPFLPEEIGALAGYHAAPFLGKMFSSVTPKVGASIDSSYIPSSTNDYLRNILLPNIVSGVNRNGS